MKRNIRSILILLLILNFLIVLNGSLSATNNPHTVKLELESVSLNYDTGSNSVDAINLRMNYTEDVHVPEWKKGEAEYPAAYIKNRHIGVQAVFSAPHWVTSAKIRAFSLSGNLGNILPETVYFENGQSSPVIFQLSKNTPKKIMSFEQKWIWVVQEVNGIAIIHNSIGYSKNKIFIVLEQPQFPWSTNGQTEPWVEALELATDWAKGMATPEKAAEKIVKHLFKETGGLYDTDWGAPYYPWSWTDFTKFALTDFLENIPDVGLVNCYDMGKSLTTLSNVLGCGLTYRYSNPFGHVNCINAIGRGWTNNPFYTNPAPEYGFDPNPLVPGDWGWDEGRSFFGNHAFGSIGDMVFDACLTVDTDNDPDDGPTFKETWMINIPWDIYQEKVVDDYPIFVFGATAYPESPTFEIY